MGDTTAFSGGNTAVFITDAGVTIVDTKLAGWGQVILDRVIQGSVSANEDVQGQADGWRRQG